MTSAELMFSSFLQLSIVLKVIVRLVSEMRRITFRFFAVFILVQALSFQSVGFYGYPLPRLIIFCVWTMFPAQSRRSLRYYSIINVGSQSILIYLLLKSRLVN